LLRGEADLPKDAVSIVSNAGLVVRDISDYYIYRRGLFGKIERLDLVCMCEQRPNRDSRLTLSENYGSGRQRLITENSPVLTQDRDLQSDYWESAWLCSYGRTKLQGESVIARAAQTVEYVILRPTRVMDIQDLVMLDNWGWLKKNIVSHRHTHHIYVRDVAHAIIWFIERALCRD
jgi:nucleoside-diphosphate-sugar epimerase